MLEDTYCSQQVDGIFLQSNILCEALLNCESCTLGKSNAD